MNTHNVITALDEAFAAFKRLPVVEAELKSAIEDRDFTKLQVDEANETIAKLRHELEIMRFDADAAKIKIANLENQIVDLNNRNADLDDTANELINQVRNLTIDVDAYAQRNRILVADKEALAAQLASAKSFGSKLAEKLQDIGQLLTATPVAEVTNIAPFPVSNAMAMPIPANAESDDTATSDVVAFVDQSSGADLVTVAPVVSDIPATETENDDSVVVGCNVYRYW